MFQHLKTLTLWVQLFIVWSELRIFRNFYNVELGVFERVGTFISIFVRFLQKQNYQEIFLKFESKASRYKSKLENVKMDIWNQNLLKFSFFSCIKIEFVQVLYKIFSNRTRKLWNRKTILTQYLMLLLKKSFTINL